MACGVVRLSAKGRKSLKCMIIFLSVVMSIISFTLILYGVYINLFIAPSLPTERSLIVFIYTVVTINGMGLVTYYAFGIKVCRKCLSESSKKHSKFVLQIWTFTGFSTVVNILIIATMAASVSNNLIRTIHFSLERGIRHYIKDVTWKKTLDHLQFKYQCCGVNSYTDWYQIAWMNVYLFKNNSDTLKRYKKYADHIFVPVVPWSCCKVSHLDQCFHDPLQQSYSLSNESNPTTTSINTIGCMEILRTPIENGFLLFIITSYFMFGLQIIQYIIFKICFTSYRSAHILGVEKGTAPGWIWGTGTAVLLSELDKITNDNTDTESFISQLSEPTKLKSNRTEITDLKSTSPEEKDVKKEEEKRKHSVKENESIQKIEHRIPTSNTDSLSEKSRKSKSPRKRKKKGKNKNKNAKHDTSVTYFYPELHLSNHNIPKKYDYRLHKNIDSSESNDETAPLTLDKNLFFM